MTDFQGALGLAQLARADAILAARRERAARYDRLLGDVEWLGLPQVPAGFVHGYQSYVTLFRPAEASLSTVTALHEGRNELMASMEARGIATRQGTHAPVLQGYYREAYGLSAEAFPRATLADRLTISLPLFPQMTDGEQDRVVEALRDLRPV
jgi:dTDP-4-amino-4,6-dideoxygalactose transaminase